MVTTNNKRIAKKIALQRLHGIDGDGWTRYENEILPLKNHLTLITNQKQRMIQKSMLFFLSILAVIHHKLSLRIISKFFLPYDETEFRIKLNNLLSVKIF